MNLNNASQIVIILAGGTAAQLLAWRLQIPSIVFLLLIGIVLGPLMGAVSPSAIFGDLLTPIVSMSVALILFEAGTTLHLKELSGRRGTVVALITIGALVAFIGITAACHYLLAVPLQGSLIIGSILVVSGPTVVIPLLHSIRLKEPLGAILKWEGILIDPIGVILAILIAEGLVDTAMAATPLHIFYGMLASLSVGAVLGVAGGAIIVLALRRYLVPDHLQLPFLICTVLLSFWASNYFYHESGLLAATLAGMIVAEKGGVSCRNILDFAANLQPLLVAFLFVVLSANLDPEHLAIVGWESLLFLAALILIVRPFSVFVSTSLSKLSIREKVLLSSIAPRGIVAASLASVLTLNLSKSGIPGVEYVLPVIFFTIIGTVLLYGSIAPILAWTLSLRQANPQGVMFVGASSFVRAFAQALAKHGVKVTLIDNNIRNIWKGRKLGLSCHHGNALSEHVQDELDLEGIGAMVALTPNDEANSLSVLEYERILGRANAYQVAPYEGESDRYLSPAQGKVLGLRRLTWYQIEELWDNGYRVRTIPMPQEGVSSLDENIFPLAALLPEKKVSLLHPEFTTTLKGEISLVVFAPRPGVGQ
ncbi:MAG: sodium:proton antiporter [Deltaproteobacteria bacterium]|nr:sodium:proton antiporter [Deltaproteobacteria bacterium]